MLKGTRNVHFTRAAKHCGLKSEHRVEGGKAKRGYCDSLNRLGSAWTEQIVQQHGLEPNSSNVRLHGAHESEIEHGNTDLVRPVPHGATLQERGKQKIFIPIEVGT